MAVDDMDNNTMIQTGANYHWKTAYDRNHMSGHFLDWENQPDPFKKYRGIQTVPLPVVSSLPEKSLWAQMLRPETPPGASQLNRDLIARLLYLTGGITAKSRQGGKDFYFRAHASAGALYPAEIYTGIFDATDLEPGVYHFGADNFALTPLRLGHFGRFLDEIGVAAVTERQPAASFFLTGIFYRSAWKYRARAFRYVLLDTGHLLENLILALTSEDLPFSCHYDFSDKKISQLIGLDSQLEAGLVCVNVLGNISTVVQDIQAVDPLSPKIIAASQVANNEVVYDDMRHIHRAGIGIRTVAKKQESMSSQIGVAATDWTPVPKTTEDEHEQPYPQSVLYRRSKRNYVNRTFEKKTFMRLLDFLSRSYEQGGIEDRFACLSVGFLTGNIDGFNPGFYLLDPEKRRIGHIATGNLIKPMTSVCLDQEWLENAAVHFLLMTNLKALDRHHGARGYRYAMLNAGRLGQLIYLGATALGLGCCGIGALYDGEAQKILGLNSDSALLYLVAAGPVKRV